MVIMHKNKGRSRDELVELCRLSREKSIINYYRDPNFCRTCNQVIQVRGDRPAYEARNKKFCNSSCAAVSTNKNRAPLQNINAHLRKRVTKICKECQSSFVTILSNSKRKFCSKRCSSKAREKVRGERSPLMERNYSCG